MSSTPITTPRPYGKTRCYRNINNAINFIDNILQDFLAVSLEINNNDENSFEYQDDIFFAEFLREQIIKQVIINGNSVNTVYNRLSCQNYCTLNGDASYDSSNNICSCKETGDLLEEFKYSDNPRIYLAQCRKSMLDNFMKQLRLVEDMMNGYDDKFKQVRLIVRTDSYPTPYNDYSTPYSTPYATPYY